MFSKYRIATVLIIAFAAVGLMVLGKGWFARRSIVKDVPAPYCFKGAEGLTTESKEKNGSKLLTVKYYIGHIPEDSELAKLRNAFKQNGYSPYPFLLADQITYDNDEWEIDDRHVDVYRFAVDLYKRYLQEFNQPINDYKFMMRQFIWQDVNKKHVLQYALNCLSEKEGIKRGACIVIINRSNYYTPQDELKLRRYVERENEKAFKKMNEEKREFYEKVAEERRKRLNEHKNEIK